MRRATILMTAGVLAMTAAPAAQAGPLGSTDLLTLPTGLAITAPVANDSATWSISGGSAVPSADGPGRRLASLDNRFVVFVSTADGIAPDDDDAVQNVYVRDVVTNTTSLVSRADGPGGAPANLESDEPAISADGTHVAFESRATNLFTGGDTAGTQQIYVRDLVAGTTRLVSRATGTAGALGDESSIEPAISGDGSIVAFSSIASNLGGGSTHREVYVRDGSDTDVVSTFNTMTAVANADSYGPSISDDGHYVAFTSEAQLQPGAGNDDNAVPDVYRRHLGTTEDLLVSRLSVTNAVGNSDSDGASISANGSRVAFTSTANNLSAIDLDHSPDVYVHDFTTGTVLASMKEGIPTPTNGDAPSFDASISASGSRVSFVTASTNLAAADTNGVQDVYVRTLDVSPSTALASHCLGAALLDEPVTEAALAPSGTRVYYGTTSDGCSNDDDDDYAQVFQRTLLLSLTEPTVWISRPSGSGPLRSNTNDSAIHGFSRSDDTPSSISADGRYTVFMSESDELSPVDDNTVTNIFVRDALTGTTQLVSRAGGADGAAANATSGPMLGSGSSGSLAGSPATSIPTISADGRTVAFTSAATNLVAGDTNGRSDVFVRNLDTQTTTLASVKTDGSQVIQDSFGPALSADGRRVAFSSKGQLDPDDPDTDSDVYVRDLGSNTTILASRQNGAGGVDANSAASGAAISGDGNRVAFETLANNLVPALLDTNGMADVYVRDLAADTTTLGSARNTTGFAGDRSSGGPSLDFTGAHLAFSSLSTNLVGGADANGAQDVFVRDIAALSTRLVSRQGANGFAGNDFSGRPSISADGTRVAFETGATDLLAGDTNQHQDILLRDLPSETTTLVSAGVGGAPADATSGNASLSANGHCVAFDSFADNLTAGPAGTDFIHGYLRAVDADCGYAQPVVQQQPPPNPPAPDRTKPVITRLSLTHTRFKDAAKKTASVAKASKKKPTPAGTTIRYTLSEKASVKIVVEQKRSGRKRKSTCVTGKTAPKHGARCTRYTTTLTLRRTARAGPNSVAFTGRVGARKLAAGSYRFAITATDAAKNTSSTHRISFTVVSR